MRLRDQKKLHNEKVQELRSLNEKEALDSAEQKKFDALFKELSLIHI